MQNNIDNFLDILNQLRFTSRYDDGILSSICVVNGEIFKLEEVKNMGYDEFSLRSKKYMPLKLYRYFPDRICKDFETGKEVNYSIQALENNLVYMQTPTEFDDVYDSDVNIDFDEYLHIRLLEYAKRCGLVISCKCTTEEIGQLFINKLWSFLLSGNIEEIFIKQTDSEMEKLSNERFILSVKLELKRTNDLVVAVNNALIEEYNDYVKSLKTIFRTACFATTPYSQLMWGGAYANNHRGFCIEYTVLPGEKEYDDIYYNLFPMIYCKTRPDISKRLVISKDKAYDKALLWDIYSNGVLRKSIDWMFQNEWRLIRPLNKDRGDDYNVKFYPITKVFLGNRMSRERRSIVIDICNRKGIPYIGVKRNVFKYEMEPCNVLCENCKNYWG